jgi:methionine synthase I (cobalamin-dependent)
MEVHPFIQELTATGPVLSDGAWGTQLQVRGLALGEFPDMWNLTHPEKVGELARAYVTAGSQIILTNTFGANRFRMADAGVADKVAAINEAGARISREAAGSNAYVFASMGPSGKMLINEDVTEAELAGAFSEQAQALALGGAHGLLVETMQDMDEARIAINAAKATGLPVIASMVFDSGKDKDRTMFGATPEQVTTALIEAGADVIGANCGQGIAGFVKVCARLKSAAGGHPIWIKANAGLPHMQDGNATYAMTAVEFVSYIPALISAGANFIGGCCGTTPEFIRKIHRQLHGK